MSNLYARMEAPGFRFHSLGAPKQIIWIDGKFVEIPKGPALAHLVLLTHNFLPVLTREYDSTSYKLGDYIVAGATVQHELIELTPEEKSTALIDKRTELENHIRSTCKFYLDQLTETYSVTKSIRFNEDRKQMESGNTAYFNRRAGARLSGAQYMESFIRPKITAGEYHADTVIGIETTLIVDLAGTADADLADFDYKTMWDEVTDFVDPPPEIVDPTWQAALKSKMRIKLW